MSEFPTALQLELMEEDNLAFNADDLPPDEQQLEVLEDIWLKAGEIEAEDAMICDAGYNVKKSRKYFQKKKRNSRDPSKPRKDKKKRDEDLNKSRKEDSSTDELTGLYTPCDSKSKKMCGKIVAPINLAKQNLDTAELVKSLVAQETDMLLSHKKKHKHKEKDHEHKKHRKRKHHPPSSAPAAVSDTESVKAEKCNPEAKEEIDSIIRAAAEEHEQSLLQSSDPVPDPKFEILPNNPPTVPQSSTATLKLFRRPKEAKLLKSKVQTIKTSKGIITVLEPSPMLVKAKEPTSTGPKPGGSMYENAFLSFLSNQHVKREDVPSKKVGKPRARVEGVRGRPPTIKPEALGAPAVNFPPTNLPKDIRVSQVVVKDVKVVSISSGNGVASSASEAKEVKLSPTNRSPFAAAFDSMHTITNVDKKPEAESGNSTTQMPQLSIPEPKDPYVEHEQMPLLDAHTPVARSRVEYKQKSPYHVTTQNVENQRSPVTNTVPVIPPLTYGMERKNPEVVPPPTSTLKHKPNLIWNNHKFYTVNQCQETSYLNTDRFYPMTSAPIKLDDDPKRKVVVEAIPVDMDGGYTALEREDLSRGMETDDVKSVKDSSSSSSCGSSCSSSDSEGDEGDCKLQLSSDDESCYNPDSSDYSDSSSDDDDESYKPDRSNTATKIESDPKDDQQSRVDPKEETGPTDDYNQCVADEMKENVAKDANKKRRNDNTANGRKKRRKARIVKKVARPAYGNGKYSRRPAKAQPPRKVIRPYLSEIILGVRKKGRPPKEVQHKFNAIRGIINEFRDRFNMKPSRGAQPSQGSLSKYLTYKKASLTPLDCRVQVRDVLSHFSGDIQNYLKSGLTLFNVSSIPIAQSHSDSDPEDDSNHQSPEDAKRHKTSDQKNEHVIEQGDMVWAKHKNGRYYKAVVLKIRTKSKMCVFFPEDQSFSKDIILSDIVDWQKIKKPTIGQRLQIRWVDGKVYDADYIGKADYSFYTVLFEDESTSHLNRDYIYALNEYIPKRIQSKLSYASDMKNRDYLYNQESPLPEKRPVKRKLYEEEK